VANSLEICRLTLAEVAQQIEHGELSPVEVTRACLDRTASVGPALNAAIAILDDQALDAARRAEREIGGGSYRGPLHGVPVGIKDLADVKGVPTTAGTHLFDDQPAAKDAQLVRQLKASGAVITVKLNCDQFAYHPTGATSDFGPTRNPWNPEVISGGSSGGTGVAIATGMVYAGLGSDTGGSIRLPAAICGVVGIKPTYGRVSLEGVRLLSQTFDTPGPMARTTLDAVAMLQAMADPATEETARAANRMALATSEIEAGVEGLRVGAPSNYFFEDNADEVNAAVRGALDTLAMLGAELVAVDIAGIDEMIAAQVGIATIEAHLNIGEATGNDLSKIHPAQRERLEGSLARVVRAGENLMLALGRYRAQRDDALASYRRGTGAIDVLVVPAVRRAPPLIADAFTDSEWLSQLTRPFNCTHQPVVSVPCGWSEAGLPIGMQIVATKYRERTAIRVACAYEQSDHAPEPRWPGDEAAVADPEPRPS
jgi:aspartyl-tRNA(Asn)/glutamyl-tRNA(Gln) amidotransferase subunit A